VTQAAHEHEELVRHSEARAIRLAARVGVLRGPTAGLAAGFLQANLVAVPQSLAADFHRFCDLNPRPCPLLAVAGPGDASLPTLGDGIDIRSDVPRYVVWRDGAPVEDRDDVTDLWRDDLVAFLLGCSFSFEQALSAEGLSPRHVTAGTNVSMYRTSVECVAAGPFHGPLVVSMRPYRPLEVERVVAITSRFPLAHGAPVHIGDPAKIGIRDLSVPDYGGPVEIGADEVPMFWACGVTPQAVIARMRIPFAITHAPGCMLVTDLRSSETTELKL
jgi:uncharacterized protein YcsI (UPF0317 family)